MTGCCPNCGHLNVIGIWTSETTIDAHCMCCAKKWKLKLVE